MKTAPRNPNKWVVLGTTGLAFAAVLALANSPSVAHEKYSDGCAACHGHFDGPISPKGTAFPNGDKHFMHRNSAWMDTDCFLCHTSIGDDPFIGSSFGTANNPGVGCTGCHGRDYGAGIGNSGVGLRAHHLNAGVTQCMSCHSNDPVPLAESVMPTYYGTADTNVDDPCNASPDRLENWSLDVDNEYGLDNDGDFLYDADEDDDCILTCLGDLDESGDVGFTDLIAVLAAWGPCPGCPEDLDMNDVVGLTDLIIILSNWGPCM